MKHFPARLVLVAACSLGGLIAIGDSARADYYPMTTGYGYSSYYGPSMYSGSWYTGYSPYWTTSYYAPAYVSYAPSCCAPACGSCSSCSSYGSCGTGACGSACGPVCGCDPCGLACATGSCGVPNQAGNSRKPAPTPDNGVPKTYEEDGKKPSTDDPEWQKRQKDAAPGGTPATEKTGDAEEQKTFKPVGPAPTIIEQRKPAPATPPADSAAPKAKLGPPESKPAAPAAPADVKKNETEKKETDPKQETEPKRDGLQPPKPGTSDLQPPVLNLDGKITWRIAPARTRLAVQTGRSDFGTLRIVRQTPRVDLNPAWVPVAQNKKPVEKSAKFVQK